MPTATFNLGRDTSLQLISPLGGTLSLSIVTAFEAKQETHQVRVRPLNGPPQGYDVPDGWTFTITLDRGSSNVDDLISDIEAGYWAIGDMTLGQLYQYVSEVNGSTSTYLFNNVTLKLSNAGNYKNDDAVTQTIEGYASTRTKL